MSGKAPALSWQCILGYAWMGFTFPMQVALAVDGIATDGTMGVAQTLNDSYVTIPQSLGTTTGGNLFHSFSEFNIAKGQTVEFTGSNALQNVISRVTGTDVTEIEGTLKSSIANSAFYLINPNGITFGAGAQVDVPGDFHISTANKIDFPGTSGAFYADRNQTSTLSSEAPVAFGFLDTSPVNNGLIDVNGSQLALKTGQTLDVTAANIAVTNAASLAATSGEVRLEAVGVNKASVPVDSSLQAAHGTIRVDSSTINSSGNGAGKITLRGGEMTVSGSSLLANNTGDTDAATGQGVDIQVDTLAITNGSRVRANLEGKGKGGDIAIMVADQLEVTDSTIRSSSSGGNGGNIKVNAKSLTLNTSLEDREAAIDTQSGFNGDAGSVTVNAGILKVFNNSSIGSLTVSAGNAGNVTVNSEGNLTIDSQGHKYKGIFSLAYLGSSGNAGDVSVRSKGDMAILNGGWISGSVFNVDTSVFNIGTGGAGNVTVISDGKLTINGKVGATNNGMGEYADITAETYGKGDAGIVLVTSKGDMTILNGGGIDSSTGSTAKGGDVTVTSGGNLTIDGISGIYSVTNPVDNVLESGGNAGTVSVASKGNIAIHNGGGIYGSTGSSGKGGDVTVKSDGNLTIDNSVGATNKFSGIYSETYQTGEAGSVSVTSGSNVTIDGMFSTISAHTYGNTNAGTVSVVSKGDIAIKNGGTIDSSTSEMGKGGDVTVTTGGNLTIDGKQGKDTPDPFTGIYSKTLRNGDAGTVSVNSTEDMTIINGGKISSSTKYGTGRAGVVTIESGGKLTIDDNNSYGGAGILSETSGNGGAGTVSVHSTRDMAIINGGKISSSAAMFSTGNGGDVTVKSDSDLNVGGKFTGIFSKADLLSTGDAGTISVTSKNNMNIRDYGEISSATSSVGKAGLVTVNAGMLNVENSGSISSDSSEGIDIDSGNSASSGQTGDVNVTATDSIRLSNLGKISIENQVSLSADVASAIQSSQITVTAPNIDMKNNSKITSNSTGNIAAGNVAINFSKQLAMGSSSITTTANSGNGGSIRINGGELIDLQNSAFKTTVSGKNSNGGDIYTSADTLVMDTGVIQANAVGGSGGNITLSLDSLIPSGNTLIKGGSTVAWQPFEAGLNVIQAASQAGVSGAVNVTAPQLNLSGIIANLGGPQFDTSIISPDYCGLGTGSSLTHKGAGGLKPKSGDQLLF